MTESEKNKKLVSDFLDETLNGLGPEVAFDKYCHPTDYRQHNPRLANGKEGYLEFARIASLCDGFSWVRHKMAADGDLVWSQSETTGFHWPDEPAPADPKSERHVFFDVWRVKDGKLVEHWDAYQKIPSHSVNGNDMI